MLVNTFGKQNRQNTEMLLTKPLFYNSTLLTEKLHSINISP
jgi:hypothetical protein